MQPRRAFVDKSFSLSQATLLTNRSSNKFQKATILILCCTISVLVSALASSSFAHTYFHSKATDRSAEFETEFDWKKIIPSPQLHWIECYEDSQCARLEVPLDYSVPHGGKAAVALLRFKAKVSPDSDAYRGPILFNPGGPGGSGVTFIRARGQSYQKILGDEYDIIGFDPRGIGETTPPVSIFPDEVERAYWKAGSPPLLNSTPDALPRAFSRAQLFNELVEARSKQAAQHVSTAVVARDMLSITKAHGRDRLQYWGFSYGTVLGATYAAMFPENIERLIIDGVVDFDDYYSGSWSKNLLDTDKILQFVYDKCAAVVTCPLHANSSALVQQRVEAIMDSIKKKPVLAINGSDYGLVDFTMVKKALFQSLYQPFTMIPSVVHALAALEQGDGRPALTVWRMIEKIPKCKTPPPLVVSSREEAARAVMCGEAASVGNTLSEIIEKFQNISKISVFADIWIETYTSCAGWKVRAKERFSGPFAVNTSFPLLIIGNTADPVTPLVGAQKAARTFSGSALLTINTPGHASAAATSLCAAKVIRNYFTLGQLPQEGTVCEIEDVLFGEQPTLSHNTTSGDAGLLEVTRTLSHGFRDLWGLRFL